MDAPAMCCLIDEAKFSHLLNPACLDNPDLG
jgi:hypothetical protein